MPLRYTTRIICLSRIQCVNRLLFPFFFSQFVDPYIMSRPSVIGICFDNKCSNELGWSQRQQLDVLGQKTALDELALQALYRYYTIRQKLVLKNGFLAAMQAAKVSILEHDIPCSGCVSGSIETASYLTVCSKIAGFIVN